jgi:polysaccharide biosynthesis transport protein
MLQQLSRVNRPVIPIQDVPAREAFPSEERLGARDVMTFVRRYAAGIGLCIAAFLVLGQIYIMITPSTFVATTQVVIESRRTGGGAGDATFAQYSLDSSQMESQVQIIKSEQIVKHVVQAMNLDKDPELNQSGASLLSTVKGWLGLSSNPASTLARASPAVRAVSDRLQARRVGQSYVIEISFWSRDADAAARICNALTAAYIDDLLQAKIYAAEAGSEVLERRLSSLRAQREAAERVVRSGTFGSETFPAADARTITTALPPEARSWPRASLVLAFSGLVGLFVGLFGAATHRGFDTALYTRDQVARALGLTTLGVLPRSRFRGLRHLATEVTRHPTSTLGTAVRQIRTALQIRQADSAMICIGITSTAAGEGKSILAANLAQALAAADSRVLLIDGSLGSGTLSDLLAPDATAGLVEMIEGPKPDKSVFVRVTAWKVDFMPVGSRKPPLTAVELPAAARIGELLNLCREHYDVVLVDLPALESGPDAKAVSPHLDGVVFVVEAGRLRADRVAAAVEALRAANGYVLGTVIGKSASGVSV